MTLALVRVQDEALENVQVYFAQLGQIIDSLNLGLDAFIDPQLGRLLSVLFNLELLNVTNVFVAVLRAETRIAVTCLVAFLVDNAFTVLARILLGAVVLLLAVNSHISSSTLASVLGLVERMYNT